MCNGQVDRRLEVLVTERRPRLEASWVAGQLPDTVCEGEVIRCSASANHRPVLS